MEEIENEAIKDLIEQNERLIQIAVVNSEQGDIQHSKDIIYFLFDLLNKIYNARSSSEKRYHQLLNSTIMHHGELRRLYSVNRDFFSDISYIDAFTSGINRIWNQAFIANQYAITRLIIFKTQKTLGVISKDSGNDGFIRGVLYLFSFQLFYGLRRGGDEKRIYITGPAYEWYFNLVLSIDDDLERIRIQYLQYYDEVFWGNLKEIILKGAGNSFKAFVSTLFQGSHSSLLSMKRAYQYFDSTRPKSAELREISDMDQKMYRIDSYKLLDRTIDRIKLIVKKYEDYLSDDLGITRVEEILIGNAEKCFKVNNLRIYVYLIGAFLVFKKRFDWIKLIWQYQQPPDADATWGGNPMLPDDLTSVFNFLLKSRDYSARVEFNWEDHHGVSTYYFQYGLLLIARLFVIPRFYVYQDPHNVLNFINNVRIGDLDYIPEICKSLKHKLKILNQSRILPTHILSNGKEKLLLYNVVNNLLSEIENEAIREKKTRLERQIFIDNDFREIVREVNTSFEIENQLPWILSQSSCCVTSKLTADVSNFETLLFNEKVPKLELISQWNEIGSKIGYSYARKMSFDLCGKIFYALKNNALKIEIRQSDLNLTKIFQKFFEGANDATPIVIGFGFDFHSHLWGDDNFKMAETKSQMNVGVYTNSNKQIPIFEVTNWSYVNSFFIIDTSSLGKIELFEADLETGYTNEGLIKAKFEQERSGEVISFILSFFSVYKISFAEAANVHFVNVDDQSIF